MSDGIRLVSVEAKNIRKLGTVAVRLDGEPGLFRVTGENEEGKTTFLDVVAMLFGGKKAVKPDTIQTGKDEAWCRAELSNGYSIERRFTPAAPNGYLTITTPDNASLNAPQGVLDGWCGPHSFDPAALLSKRTSDIEAIILGLAKDPALKEKREAIAAKREKLREERRPLNSAKQRAERTAKPKGERPEPVDVSATVERLRGLRSTSERKAELTRTVIRLDSMARGVEEDIETAEEAIAALEEQIKTLHGNIETMKDAWKRKQEQIKEAEAERDALPDTHTDIAEAEALLAEADEINRTIEPWREWDRAQAEATRVATDAKKLTKAIKALDAEEEALLKAAEIPVRGISFSEEGDMLLDEHPLEVASGMRRLDMTVDIAFAANSNVCVCLLDEANDYGLTALKHLDQRAREKHFQVLACRIGLEGPGEIIVHDGEAVTS